MNNAHPPPPAGMLPDAPVTPMPQSKNYSALHSLATSHTPSIVGPKDWL